MSRLRQHLPAVAALAVIVPLTLLAIVRADTITGDTWYNLVAGRELWTHGLAHHDQLAVLSRGRVWTDQQWLAQLVFYGLYQLGGLHILAALHLACYTAAVMLCWAAGRRRSGSSAAALLGVLVLALTLGGWWVVTRAQDFSALLFGLFLYLIARDRDRHGRWIFVLLPLTALWANLHGAVLLGAALAALYGLYLLAGPRRSGALLLLAPLCAFASPYSPLALGRYYKTMLFSKTLPVAVLEWKPVGFAADPLLFLSAALIIGLLVWRRRQADLFEACALLAVLAGALLARRNIIWYGLAAAALLPPLLPALPARFSSLRAAVDKLGAALVVAFTVLVLVLGGARYLPRPAMPSALLSAIGPGNVYANGQYADWLLWQRPGLRGRIAFDVRYELLNEHDLVEISNGESPGGRYQQLLAPYRYVLVSSSFEADFDHALARDPAFAAVGSADGAVLYRRR